MEYNRISTLCSLILLFCFKFQPTKTLSFRQWARFIFRMEKSCLILKVLVVFHSNEEWRREFCIIILNERRGREKQDQVKPGYER